MSVREISGHEQHSHSLHRELQGSQDYRGQLSQNKTTKITTKADTDMMAHTCNLSILVATAGLLQVQSQPGLQTPSCFEHQKSETQGAILLWMKRWTSNVTPAAKWGQASQSWVGSLPHQPVKLNESGSRTVLWFLPDKHADLNPIPPGVHRSAQQWGGRDLLKDSVKVSVISQNKLETQESHVHTILEKSDNNRSQLRNQTQVTV